MSEPMERGRMSRGQLQHLHLSEVGMPRAIKREQVMQRLLEYNIESVKGSQHLLPRAFAKLEKRGEVQEIGHRQLNERTGELTIFYRRLKPPVPAYVRRLKRAAVIVAVAATAYLLLRVVVGVVISLFPFLLGAVGVAAALLVILSLSRGHACAGLHCDGCKG